MESTKNGPPTLGDKFIEATVRVIALMAFIGTIEGLSWMGGVKGPVEYLQDATGITSN